MFEFDPFSSFDSVDFTSFEPAFTWDTFDAGFTDLGAWTQDFDLGGLGDAGTGYSEGWGYGDFDVPATDYSAPLQDGSYTDLGGDWSFGTDAELNIPSGQNGVVWEADFPYSGDGFNLPNVSAGQMFDVAKGAASVYTMTQSGPAPKPTTRTSSPQNASTNGSVFQSILGNITGAIKSGATAVANIEDTRQRIVNANTVNTQRGAGSGILGPRTTTQRGSATTRSNAPSTAGTVPSPVLVALAAIGGLLLFKGAS